MAQIPNTEENFQILSQMMETVEKIFTCNALRSLMDFFALVKYSRVN